ncbi:hypothetical protein DFR50_1596 [Roseiarcus fermentans]|uniref:Uncharacterized protein n=1 Tax=Roseiarcus fermentans TaxID=1473586 RepID=A0A366EF63_9HYPH|nr:hypothetical protein [Roseiarcus fermentans]RBP01061.1 hypothetical protein DFR50_1596 [Roseiarcus fermentans]
MSPHPDPVEGRPAPLSLPEIAQCEAVEDLAARVLAAVADAVETHGADPETRNLVACGLVRAVGMIGGLGPDVPETVRFLLNSGVHERWSNP